MLFFVRLTESINNEEGFHTINIPAGNTLELNNSKTFSVFLSSSIPTSDTNFSHWKGAQLNAYVPFNSQSLEIFDDQIKIVQNSTADLNNLNYWRIPMSTCTDVSYFITADYIYNSIFDANYLAKTMCIFPQPNAQTYEVSLEFLNSSGVESVEFYKSPLRKVKSCTGAVKCQFISHEPFFMRIYKPNLKPVLIDLNYKASGVQSKISRCSIDTIHLFTEKTLMVPKNVLRAVSTVCRTKAEANLKIISITAFTVTCALIVIAILEFSGVIDVGYAFGCTPQKSRFTDIKNDPYIKTIDNPVDFPGSE